MRKFRPWHNVAVVLYDIAAEKISATHTYVPPYSATYPVSDRYISVGNFSPINIFDAQTGEVTELIEKRIARVCDAETLIVQDYASLDADNAPVYVCDINNPDDTSNLLLHPRQAQALIRLHDITDNYTVFGVRDFDGEWIAAAKY